MKQNFITDKFMIPCDLFNVIEIMRVLVKPANKCKKKQKSL